MASSKTKRKRPVSFDDAPDEQTMSIGLIFVLVLVLIAVACLVVGFVRKGMDWPTVLTSFVSLVTGIGFVAIGLLELEWLERVIGFVDGIFSGLSQYFWTTQMGSLDENIGRRGARVVWLMFGIPIFAWGCLLALRVFEL